MELDSTPLEGELARLQPLAITVVGADPREAEVFRGLLQRHHYLGWRNGVGENLRYLVRERGGRPVAALLFGSAAWHCQPRDAFLGWSAEDRRRHLPWVTNNTRFQIPPWAVCRIWPAMSWAG